MIGTSPNCPVAGTNGPVLGPCVADNVCHRHYSPIYTDNSDDGCRGFRSVSPSRSAISKEICLAFHDNNDNNVQVACQVNNRITVTSESLMSDFAQLSQLSKDDLAITFCN